MAWALLQNRQPARESASSRGIEAAAEIDKLRLRQRQGKERWHLKAEHAVHFPEAGYTRLRFVHLAVRRKRSPPFRVYSRMGRVEDGSHEIILRGDVRVIDPEGYRLSTNVLHYLPSASQAKTQEPVRIVADFGRATGIGATLWIELGRVRLHKQVSTTFWRRPVDPS